MILQRTFIQFVWSVAGKWTMNINLIFLVIRKYLRRYLQKDIIRQFRKNHKIMVAGEYARRIDFLIFHDTRYQSSLLVSLLLSFVFCFVSVCFSWWGGIERYFYIFIIDLRLVCYKKQELPVLCGSLSSPPEWWGICYWVSSFMCMICRSLFLVIALYVVLRITITP